MFYNRLKTQFEINTSTQHFEKEKKNKKLLFVILKQNTEILSIRDMVVVLDSDSITAKPYIL